MDTQSMFSGCPIKFTTWLAVVQNGPLYFNIDVLNSIHCRSYMYSVCRIIHVYIYM